MPLQDVVRSARGNKLDTSNEDDLWSGRVWTGRQATKLGLIDGVGSMESVCKQKFGDKVCDHISISPTSVCIALVQQQVRPCILA